MTIKPIKPTPSRAAQLIDNAARLTPPSTSVGQLMMMIDDGRSDMRLIGRFVAADPVLASDALRVANSVAFASQTGPIDDCVMAVVRLGETMICSLIAARLKGLLARSSLPGYEMQESGLWKHSLRVAIAARQLARHGKGVKPAVAYTAGLLVDIGKLLMADSVAERWDDLMLLVGAGDHVSFDQAERQLFGIDHAALGAAATRFWAIPEPIPTAIGASHQPSLAPPEMRALAAIVHVADALVTQLGVGAGADGMGYTLDVEALASLELDRDTLALVLRETELEFKDTESALGAAA